MRINATLDGRSTLAVERVQEKIRFNRLTEVFYLGRAPILIDDGDPIVNLLMLGDDVLLNTQIEIVGADSRVRLLDDDGEPISIEGDVIIDYTAGYALPGDTSPNANATTLPGEIEQAMFVLLRGAASTTENDPSIRSKTSEEVDSFTFFAEGAMAVAWRDAEQYLAPFRRLIP